MNRTKAVLRLWHLGTTSKGEKVSFADAVVRLGMDFDRYCERLVDSELDQGIDYLQYVLRETRIDGEECPDPNGIAVAIIAHLQERRDLVAPDRDSVAEALARSDDDIEAGRRVGVGPGVEAANKTLLAGSLCLVVMDPATAFLAMAVTYVLARRRLI